MECGYIPEHSVLVEETPQGDSKLAESLMKFCHNLVLYKKPYETLDVYLSENKDVIYI